MTKRLIRCRTIDGGISRRGRVGAPEGSRLKNSVSAPLTFDTKPAPVAVGPTADHGLTADRGSDINERHRRFWAREGIGTTPTRDAARSEDINEINRRFWANQAGK